MKISCYQLKKDTYISPVPWQGLADGQQVAEPDYDYWVEADGLSVEEIEMGLKQLNVHPLILADFLNSEHSTLIDRYPEAVYIELPTNADPKHSGGIAYLSIICLPSLMITIRRGELPQLPRLITLLEKEERLEIGNTSNLLYKIIDYFIERTVNQSFDYRRHINRLEEQLQQEPETINSNELADLRRRLTQLEYICADQQYCTTSLVTHRHKAIEMIEQEAYFNDLVTDSEHALRNTNRLNGRLKDLQDNLELRHQDSTEKRLRILTILSAIFLPLSFITGFFGMNFVNMPVYQWQYGMPFFLVIMIVISLILMWYFYSRGWID